MGDQLLWATITPLFPLLGSSAAPICLVNSSRVPVVISFVKQRRSCSFVPTLCPELFSLPPLSAFYSNSVFTYLFSLLELHEGRGCGWPVEMLNKCLLKESIETNKWINVISYKLLWRTENTWQMSTDGFENHVKTVFLDDRQ